MAEIILADVFILWIGLCVGSFMNVCIHRFLREESIVTPRSYCPSCKKTISWYDNIPLVSFILLGGRCRNCKATISPRYFFIEFMTGLAFLGSVHYFGWTAYAGSSIVFLTLLLAISAADLEERIIPDELSLSGILFGVLFSTFFPMLQHEETYLRGFLASLFGAFVGGGIIYATGILGELAFKKESMGGGDVKLMAMMGAFLGWKNVLAIFFLAPMIALPIGLYVKFKKKEDYIPYGPFLSLAAVVILFFGDVVFRLFFYNYY